MGVEVYRASIRGAASNSVRCAIGEASLTALRGGKAAAYCFLPTAYCLLPTAYYFLLSAYCFLLFSSPFLSSQAITAASNSFGFSIMMKWPTPSHI